MKLTLLILIVLNLNIAKAENYFDDSERLSETLEKQKIAVLIGLGLNHVVKRAPDFMGPMIARQIEVIKDEFTKKFGKNDYTIDYSYYPDRYTVRSVLSSPEYVAVFWIGHGAEVKDGGKIFDGDNFDLTETLDFIHPNLRFLALISCYSTKALRTVYSKKQLAKTNPKLRIITFNKKIEMHPAIQVALKDASKTLNKSSIRYGYACMKKYETGIRIKIKRKCAGNNITDDGFFPAVTVKNTKRNKIFATLPPCLKAGEIQQVYAHIPLYNTDFNKNGELENVDALHLQISTGEKIIKNFNDILGVNIGEFTITHDDEEKWFGIIDPDTGTSTNIDILNFSLLKNNITVTNIHRFNKYFCKDMPVRKY